MTNNLKCPVCNEQLEQHCLYKKCCVCSNPCCRMYNRTLDPFLLKLLQDGKAARNALNKILAVKESVEGCCVEIQHVLSNAIQNNLVQSIDKEVSAIDKYMSEIDEIAKITTGKDE